MKLLLKQTLIADTNSPVNQQVKDILISDGKIHTIADQLDDADAQILNIEALTVSPGWIDTFAHFNDPGLEYKETLETGADAAAAGGFTHVMVVPNTTPVISNKAYVEYIVQKSRALPVHILPLGAVTKNAEGKELAEMYDMRNSGAVAFTDGTNPVQTPGLFLKALQYVKSFDGVIVQLPIDLSVGAQGLINEGITSTQLGLPGLPAIAEELLVSRDIELAAYTGSRLHITGVSTNKSIALIAAAKHNGVRVTCSATPYQLWFCDEDLHDYDTNLKVNPPLRSRADMLSLREAVLNGTVDCIASHHMPQNWDNKTCEFEYAKNGMIGLETSFPVINTLFPTISIDQLISLYHTNAASLFNITISKIEEGAPASLTLFSREQQFVFEKRHIKSKSANTPFVGTRFTGKVVGIINKDKLYLND